MEDPSRRGVLYNFSIYALTGAATLAVLALAYRPWEADLTVPLYYTSGQDLYNILMLVKTVVDTGWCVSNPHLGAPGILELYDYPLVDAATFLTIKLIALGTRDAPLILNLYFFSTFLTIAWTSLFAARRLGVSDLVSAGVALLFAFAPYHIWRGPWHLLQSSYGSVPLALMAALWLGEGGPLFFDRDDAGRLRPRWVRGRTGAVLFACAFIGMSHAYYALFGTFFLAVGGLIGLMRRPALARCLDAALVVGLSAGGFAAQLAPMAVYSHRHGANREPTTRPARQAEEFALDLDTLFRPTRCHRLFGGLDPALAAAKRQLGRRVFTTCLAIKESELCTPLGIVGAGGFVLIVAAGLGLTGRAGRDAPLLGDAGRLAIAGVLLGVAGGFGVIVARHLSPVIRCYNRIGIYVDFLSLLGAGLVADRLLAGRRLAVRVAAVAAAVALGLLDEIPDPVAPDYPFEAAAFRSDGRFVRRVEESVPPGSRIFQLPYAPYPEAYYTDRMGDYDHFRCYFPPTRLRWSYGAMRGRPTAKWQQGVASLPIPELVPALAQAGFAGIVVHRLGYRPAKGEEIVRGLAAETGQTPFVSGDGQLVFFAISNPAASSGGGEGETFR